MTTMEDLFVGPVFDRWLTSDENTDATVVLAPALGVSRHEPME
jgi:hypothetical protein